MPSADPTALCAAPLPPLATIRSTSAVTAFFIVKTGKTNKAVCLAVSKRSRVLQEWAVTVPKIAAMVYLTVPIAQMKLVVDQRSAAPNGGLTFVVMGGVSRKILFVIE